MGLWRFTMILLGLGLLGLCCAGGEKADDDDDHSAGGGPTYDPCEEQCRTLHPAGAEEYDAFRTCVVCGACHDSCSESTSGLCGGTTELGCSSEFPDCAACVASPCAAEQTEDLTFTGLCAEAADACAAIVACVQLNNCVAACEPGGAGGAG